MGAKAFFIAGRTVLAALVTGTGQRDLDEVSGADVAPSDFGACRLLRVLLSLRTSRQLGENDAAGVGVESTNATTRTGHGSDPIYEFVQEA